MNTQNSNNRIRKEISKSPILVSRIMEDQYREGLLVAELKQTVTIKSYYPSKSVTSNLQDNPFGASDFGFEEQEFESTETRVAWINVPLGTTVQDVEAKLAALPEAVIYKILSNKPILTDNQKYAVDNGITTLDNIAKGQVVRYPESHEKAGQIASDQAGKIQYRCVFFKSSSIEDLDERTADPSDMYLSEELKTELNGVRTISGQSIDD